MLETIIVILVILWLFGYIGPVVIPAFPQSGDLINVILVIAMMVCPAATARMLTDDLRTQVAISAVVAIASGATICRDISTTGKSRSRSIWSQNTTRCTCRSSGPSASIATRRFTIN